MPEQRFRIAEFGPVNGAESHGEIKWPDSPAGDESTAKEVDVYSYIGYKDFPAAGLDILEEEWLKYQTALRDRLSGLGVQTPPPQPLTVTGARAATAAVTVDRSTS